MKPIVSFLTIAALAACGGNPPATTTGSPRARITQASPEGALKAGGDCNLVAEAEVEAIVGTDVGVTEGSCTFKTTNDSGLNGSWETSEWSEAGWEGVKSSLGGQRQQGFGDEAYVKDDGGLAQMGVKKGSRQLLITVSDPGGKAKDLMLKLAEKIVAAM
jgi:hypothetical protein